jgi:tetratricopeptide (TPR) repeat protein
VLAELEQQLGDYGAAIERLARIPDSPDVAVGIARLRGRIALENGRPQEAADQLARAEVAGAIDGTASWPLTIALCELGRFDEARARASQQLAAAGSDEPRLRLDALANLGAVLLHEGDVERADEVLEQARTLAQSLGDVMRLAHVTGDLAGARFMAGRLAEAASLLDEATGLAHGLGARRVVAMTLGNLSQIRLAAGDQDGRPTRGARRSRGGAWDRRRRERAQLRPGAGRRRRARRRAEALGGVVEATVRPRAAARPARGCRHLRVARGSGPRGRWRRRRCAQCDRACKPSGRRRLDDRARAAPATRPRRLRRKLPPAAGRPTRPRSSCPHSTPHCRP